jgi:hypothetical protein
VNDHGGRTKRGQRLLAGFDCARITVDSKQPAARRDPIQDLAGVARLPEGAVDRYRALPGPEQLYYLL